MGNPHSAGPSFLPPTQAGFDIGPHQLRVGACPPNVSNGRLLSALQQTTSKAPLARGIAPTADSVQCNVTECNAG